MLAGSLLFMQRKVDDGVKRERLCQRARVRREFALPRGELTTALPEYHHVLPHVFSWLTTLFPYHLWVHTPMVVEDS